MGNTIVHLAAHAKQFVRDTILKEAEQQVGEIRRSGFGHCDAAFLHSRGDAQAHQRLAYLIDADYEKAAHLAALVAPYRTAAEGRNWESGNSQRLNRS